MGRRSPAELWSRHQWGTSPAKPATGMPNDNAKPVIWAMPPVLVEGPGIHKDPGGTPQQGFVKLHARSMHEFMQGWE